MKIASLKNLGNQRYLIDDDDVVAGLGHLMASFNIGLKVSLRHKLTFVPGLSGQSQPTLRARLSATLRNLLARPRNTSTFTHQDRLHEGYRSFLHFGKGGPLRSDIDRWVNNGEFRLIELPEPIHGHLSDDAKYMDIDAIISSNPGDKVVFKLPSGRLSRCDANYDLTRPTLMQLYAKARLLDPVNTLFRIGSLSVAVNIRRGDIVREAKFRNRLLPDSYYCNIINRLSNVFDVQDLHVIVFSDADSAGQYINEDGLPVSWRSHPLIRHGISIDCHLDESKWLEAIHNMIIADIFVTSRSGFSHLAATLRNGVTLACPMWEPYCSGTNIIGTHDPLGDFNADLLLAALESHRKAHYD